MSNNSENSIIQDFIKDARANAESFEKGTPVVGTQPTMSDVRQHLQNSRNEITLGERTYNIKKFGIRDTISLVPILGNALAVPLSALVKDGGDGEGGIDVSGLTETLLLLFGELGDGSFYEILELLLSKTTLNEKKVDIETDFEDLTEVLEVAVKVLALNYSAFMKFPVLSNLMTWGTKLQQLQPQQ